MAKQDKDEELFDHIMRCIIESYGSTDCPDYGAIWKRYDDLFYARPIRELLHRFSLEETTDPNCDLAVILTLVLPGEPETIWFVKLSLVGPFATVMRYHESDEEARVQLLTPMRADLCGLEEQLLDLLRCHHIEVLDEDMLTRKIRFCHVNEEPGLVPLYRVLFYMEDEPLPWEG